MKYCHILLINKPTLKWSLPTHAFVGKGCLNMSTYDLSLFEKDLDRRSIVCIVLHNPLIIVSLVFFIIGPLFNYYFLFSKSNNNFIWFSVKRVS